MLIGFTLLPYWLSVTKCRSLFILSNIHPNIRLSLGRYIIHINSNTRLSIGFYDVHVKCVNSIIIQQFIQHYEIYISRYSVQYPLATLAYVVWVSLLFTSNVLTLLLLNIFSNSMNSTSRYILSNIHLLLYHKACYS